MYGYSNATPGNPPSREGWLMSYEQRQSMMQVYTLDYVPWFNNEDGSMQSYEGVGWAASLQSPSTAIPVDYGHCLDNHACLERLGAMGEIAMRFRNDNHLLKECLDSVEDIGTMEE